MLTEFACASMQSESFANDKQQTTNTLYMLKELIVETNKMLE